MVQCSPSLIYVVKYEADSWGSLCREEDDLFIFFTRDLKTFLVMLLLSKFFVGGTSSDNDVREEFRTSCAFSFSWRPLEWNSASLCLMKLTRFFICDRRVCKILLRRVRVAFLGVLFGSWWSSCALIFSILVFSASSSSFFWRGPRRLLILRRRFWRAWVRTDVVVFARLVKRFLFRQRWQPCWLNALSSNQLFTFPLGVKSWQPQLSVFIMSKIFVLMTRVEWAM